MCINIGDHELDHFFAPVLDLIVVLLAVMPDAALRAIAERGRTDRFLTFRPVGGRREKDGVSGSADERARVVGLFGFSFFIVLLCVFAFAFAFGFGIISTLALLELVQVSLGGL